MSWLTLQSLAKDIRYRKRQGKITLPVISKHSTLNHATATGKFALAPFRGPSKDCNVNNASSRDLADHANIPKKHQYDGSIASDIYVLLALVLFSTSDSSSPIIRSNHPATMKSYNLLRVLLVAVSVAVDVKAVNKPAVRSSRIGRTSAGNTRKFIVEVEPVKKPVLSLNQSLTLAESRHGRSDTPTPHET